MQVVDVSSYFESDKQIDFILDDIHPGGYSGNKKWKLKYNLLDCLQKGKKGILTFGGAYSNHIAATAEACRKNRLRSIGVIRGEKVKNSTLNSAQENGMELIFVSREEYRERNHPDYLKNIKFQFSDFLVVPEGGSNYNGLLGCVEFFKKLQNYQVLVLSAGTGCTAAGACLIDAFDVHVYPALKGNWMRKEILEHGHQISDINEKRLHIFNEYHFGAYAKYDSSLLKFIKHFKMATGISLEQVYTGKMMYGFECEFEKGAYERYDKIALVHTGGLQGAIDELL